jgi:hypothetical protein
MCFSRKSAKQFSPLYEFLEFLPNPNTLNAPGDRITPQPSKGAPKATMVHPLVTIWGTNLAVSFLAGRLGPNTSSLQTALCINSRNSTA